MNNINERSYIKDVVYEVLDEKKEEINFNVVDIWFEYMMYSAISKEESTCANDESIFNLHIAPYFSNHKILDITPKDIIDWHLSMKKHLSYQTVVNNHRTFSKMFVWVDTLYDTKWNPLSKVGAPKKTDKKDDMLIWSEYDFFKFYSVIDNLEHKIIFLLLYFGGFRRGELLALKWNDFINNHLRVDESCANIRGKQVIKKPKTFNSYRLVEIDPQTLSLLNIWHDHAKESPTYHPENFIIGRKTRPMAFETLRQTKIRYEMAANVPHISIHDMRHSHVSLLINNHMPVIGIAQRIGDTIDEVLQTYSHLLPQTSLEISNFLKEITMRYK
ncbi:tyrosine-type recombinase/integrase [Breznakia pachnodae]|uniref:Integrase n=1 Tax=Breznakia pachnodae TaxID=265178 RepID=A0ABU0E0Q3_9FIRM|nr:site-specific integrase [Breznakia pachnodae]MDQ0360472.1 integrase [Breznakia pachnodae]